MRNWKNSDIQGDLATDVALAMLIEAGKVQPQVARTRPI
jgi:hypothetical protein